MVVITMLFALAFLLFSGCSVSTPNELEQEKGGYEEAFVKEAAEANNRFAIDLYREYHGLSGGNIFFSPYSISSAFAMVYEGAEGETAEEIREVFNFPADRKAMRKGFLTLDGAINKGAEEYTLRSANGLWGQKDYPFLSEYFEKVKNYYKAEIAGLDFRVSPEPSRQIINGWVLDRTEGLIKDLIPSGAIGSLTRMVLVNAIYFRGIWLREFDSDKTEKDYFHVSSSEKTRVPFMRSFGDESDFYYFSDDLVQVIEIPYAGEELSMVVALPSEGKQEKFDRVFSHESIEEWKKSLKKQRVDVFFPRFKFDSKYYMSGVLAKMGMPSAFRENADFSGMSRESELFISEAIHQAFVDVDEKGTEAAAATAVIIRVTSMPAEKPDIPVFRADRPFVFIVLHKETGAILFMGRVFNPSG